jgi:hypothetical protein
VSVKPENTFRRLVRDHLPGSIYRQSMALTMSNGTPDDYYDGRGGDLWVEYKWLPKPPIRGFIPKLTELQLLWLERRWRNGQNAWVIVGFPMNAGSMLKKHGIISVNPHEWRNGIDPKLHNPLSAAAIAARISTFVGGEGNTV